MKNLLISMLMNYVVKNWRTTLVGAIGWAALHFPQVTGRLLAHGYTVADLQTTLILVVAFLAKDGATTGVAPAPRVEGVSVAQAAPPAGYARLRLLILLAVAVGALSIAKAARADDPKFGGCVGATCFAPTVSINVLAVRLYDGTVTSTFDPGIGYGVTIASDKWYKAGLSTTFSFPTFEAGRRVQPAAIFSFAEYARLGVACPLWVAGGFQRNAQILLGFGADFGRW